MGMLAAPQRKRPRRSGAVSILRLVDDLNDSMCGRIDQNSTIIHNRVAVFRHAILSRHVIIGDAVLRQILAHAYLTLVGIRGNAALLDIGSETRTRVVGDSASYRTNAGAHGCPDRASDYRPSNGTLCRACRSTILSIRNDGK